MYMLASAMLFIAGSALGAGLARKRRQKHLKSITANASEFLSAAEGQAREHTQHNHTTTAALRIAKREELQRAREQNLQALRESEAEINLRETLQNTRSDEQDSHLESLQQQRITSREHRERASAMRKQATETHTSRIHALERQCGTPRKTLRDELISTRVDTAQLRAQRRLRAHNEAIQKQATAESRRLITTAIHRYNGVGHLERIQSIIPLPTPRLVDAWADPQGPAQQALLHEIPCILDHHPEAGQLLVRGDNPLAREIARRSLRQIAKRTITSPQKIRTIAQQCTTEVDREVKNAARKAVRMLQLSRVHPEILELVGRLKFRLSYSQNQLKHAVEVGYLAGMMAEELGLDVPTARRGGLLHDIGKAMTHDHEGSHAVLGAEVARRCGEDEVVANAIGAHHNDEPMATPIAHIVTACDAISGGRPGARRETVTLYLDRVNLIHTVASRPRSVERVEVMNGGREVRVIVASHDQGDVEEPSSPHRPLDESELPPLAQEIATQLEEEVTFPGQIKVTVIRESRSVSTAR